MLIERTRFHFLPYFFVVVIVNDAGDVFPMAKIKKKI